MDKITIRLGHDYFGPPIEVNNNIEASKLLNTHPTLSARIEVKNERILMKPEINGTREIEGFTSLSLVYVLFNDINFNKHSHVGCSDGPGRVYYSHDDQLNRCPTQ